MDCTQKMQTFNGYVDALEEEKKKILVFHRELPLSLELVNQAIESCRKELSTPEQVNSRSECSERTTSECGGAAAVCEEFIPMKCESCKPNKDNGADEKTATVNNVDEKKSDWLSLRSLHSPDPHPKVDEVIIKKTKVVEVKRNAGAFQPFQKPLAAKIDSQPLKAISPTTSTSTAESGGGKRDSEQQRQSLTHRKQRRCWSPELHRRFLNSLQQLGGSNVATPKQIRDLMKVDGLTNDEVKSHLQKYRLHTRRPAVPAVAKGSENIQQPQFMVVEGIWVPSHDTTNNKVYAPVAVQPQQSAACGDRSNGRCKSPARTSYSHTRHLLPLS